MGLVLDETAYAATAIKTRTLGKKPFETLYRVARYYIDNGYDKSYARDALDQFLIQCDPTASLPKWSDTLDTAVRRACKYQAIKIDKIDISTKEIEKIKAIKGVQLQRLAFTLLCLAKFWLIVNPDSNGWVTVPENEIMKMANINTSHIRQNMMYNTLFESGLISLPKRVDSTSVQVLFMEDGETAVSVNSLTNVGYQYMLFMGNKNYLRCENCGIVFKRPIKTDGRGRIPKYCPGCASEVKMTQNINSVMRIRSNKY